MKSESYFRKFETDANNAGEIIVSAIDPARCKPWKYHNRDLDWLTAENCADLISSIQQNGQVEPILLRKLPENVDSEHDYEIIYGVRRWYACSQIPNQMVLAAFTEADDKTCMILMHTENANSKDISEFERAFSFSQQFKSGIFKNQTEMAKAMGVSQGLISRMIKAAELFEHDWLKKLFKNKLEIKIKPAYKLVNMLKDNFLKNKIQEVAKMLETRITAGEQFSTKKILKTLLLSASGSPEHLPKEVMYPIGLEKHILCKRDARGKLTFTFDADISENHRDALVEAMKNAVDHLVFPEK